MSSVAKRMLRVAAISCVLPLLVAAAPPDAETDPSLESLPNPDELADDPEAPEDDGDPDATEQPSSEVSEPADPDASDEPTGPTGPVIVELAKPKWIKHTIIPGERIGDIAARYEVGVDSLLRWNKLDKKNPKIFAGRELAVLTKHIPPPCHKITYTVVSGDTWAKIAANHHVDADKLRERWNPKVPRKFKAGQEIVIWIDPLTDPNVQAGTSGGGGPPLPLLHIPSGALSVGKPADGRISNAVQLPENRQLYTIRKPDEAYGSTHTLVNLQLAIAVWRRDSGFKGSLKIGSISKQGGGKLKPHSSHRSGRDVDIRLPVRKKDGSADEVDDVDWDALWSLVVALVDTGEVETIYLTTDRQKHLYAAAKRAGASAKRIDEIMQYPEKGGRNNGIVRNQSGHTGHIHVRFACAPNESACENN